MEAIEAISKPIFECKRANINQFFFPSSVLIAPLFYNGRKTITTTTFVDLDPSPAALKPLRSRVLIVRQLCM
ncbi:unnamed protein product [Prunus armeniaca]|uniref:Uncharacterized protein n=1 Tax=Prunus armeniaca TaxID=36596 RepID=A0A6J5TYA6_PRUAR|nr:unnamed protein product [Prunus armeniaca]